MFASVKNLAAGSIKFIDGVLLESVLVVGNSKTFIVLSN